MDLPLPSLLLALGGEADDDFLEYGPFHWLKLFS